MGCHGIVMGYALCDAGTDGRGSHTEFHHKAHFLEMMMMMMMMMKMKMGDDEVSEVVVPRCATFCGHGYVFHR